MSEIGVMQFRIYTENRNGKDIAICPNCGAPLIFLDLQRMPPAETGFFYCSDKCAKADVEKDYTITEEEE